MNTQHKNKAIAALLAFLGGTIGLHHFYLKGRRDKWAWLHLISLPISLLIYFLTRDVHPFFTAIPVMVSMLAGFIACLMIGTTPDEKWDAQHNASSSQKSDTGWPIALILIMALGVGASILIAVIARTFDLLFTGGLYG
jgi:TM2 domain-containing membrane protein YozV